MEKLIGQTTAYLKGFKERIEKDWLTDSLSRDVVSKIEYILEKREKWEEPKLCQDTCDGSCKNKCINRQ